MVQTFTPSQQIAAFRSAHRIVAAYEDHADFGKIARCEVCGIRVHWIIRQFRHDLDEVKALLDGAYGSPESWGRERAIERVLETTDEDGEYNREGDPAFNGAFR